VEHPIHKQVPITDIVRGCVYTIAMCVPGFKNLSMDMQGSIVVQASKNVIEFIESSIHKEA
jgi:hypothetical protein